MSKRKGEEIFCIKCGVEIPTVDKVLHHGFCTKCFCDLKEEGEK